MKKVISHYRVPQSSYKGQTRGRPSPVVLHRYYRGDGFHSLADMKPCSRGGMTFCDIFDGEKLVAIGTAKCSYADNFDYKIGRDIAIGRAEKNLLNQSQEVW